MRTHTFPRLLLSGFLFAFIAATALAPRAMAKGPNDWTETVTGENEFVTACGGFGITTSYTSFLNYHLVEDASGDEVFQRLNVSFVGALTNAENGQSLQYNGKFTRTSDYHIGRVTISDL